MLCGSTEEEIQWLNVPCGEMYILRERERESAVVFKRQVLKAKLLSSGERPDGFRSSLVSIRRKFIIVISMAHVNDREKGVTALLIEAFAPKRKGWDVSENATSSRDVFFFYFFFFFFSLSFCVVGTWPMMTLWTITLVSSSRLVFSSSSMYSCLWGFLANACQLNDRDNWLRLSRDVLDILNLYRTTMFFN